MTFCHAPLPANEIEGLRTLRRFNVLDTPRESLLLGCVREGNIVVCLSGDEFVVALYGLASRRNAASIAKKILSASSDRINFEGETLTVSASIGISVCPNDAEEPAPLIRLADSAMYRAKREGRNAFRFYSQ